MELPGPLAHLDDPVVRNDHPDHRVGRDHEFVDPAEFRVHVLDDVFPESVSGIGQNFLDHGMVGPLVMGPEDHVQGQGQRDQTGQRQETRVPGIRLQEGPKAGEGVVDAHGEEPVAEQVY